MSANSPKVILLTGGLAAGKSTAAQLLAEKGFAIIDTDLIARSLLEPKTEFFQAVVRHFGLSILDASEKINRRKLREIIFQSPQDKKFLEDLLHPQIQLLTYQQVEHLKQAKNSPRAIVIVVPLFVSKTSYPADFILTIEAKTSLQIERVMARDGISKALATKMLASQAASETRQLLADQVIWNEGDLGKFKETLTQIFSTIL